MHRSLLFVTVLLVACLPRLAHAQEGAETYVPPDDPQVQEKLEAWQDIRFGLMMHWGTYSQWGIVESWSLCAEDVPWCSRSMDDYAEYKEAYEALQTSFAPTQFDPERWAQAARDAGMRYVVFTTKHHDGFNMFDTQQSDYKITAEATPFSSDPRADVTEAIFDAFRAEGFMIGAYFSKPDWHSPYYWWPRFATPDRHVNYSIEEHPERWQQFVDFTHAQVDELMTGYGEVDLLWLDGGWVRPLTPALVQDRINDPDYDFTRVQSQPIDMDGLVRKAREKQPGLIVVNRAVPGRHQDYLTPEARVPDEVIEVPWEVPMPMAGSWSYVPDDRYKPARQLVHMLIEVVAKGGNLLLNVGPGPDGTWHEAAYERLRAIGDWMDVNGRAIYHSNPLAPHQEGKQRMVRHDDGQAYVFYLADEGETAIPAHLLLTQLRPAEGATVRLLGHDAPLDWRHVGTGFMVDVPEDVRQNPPSDYAWTFEVSAVDGPDAAAPDAE